MALIRVINNYTGHEGEVGETWLERWPEDFTALSDDHVPLAIQEQLAAEADPNTPVPDPVTEEPPSDGTTEEIN